MKNRAELYRTPGGGLWTGEPGCVHQRSAAVAKMATASAPHVISANCICTATAFHTSVLVLHLHCTALEKKLKLQLRLVEILIAQIIRVITVFSVDASRNIVKTRYFG